MRLLLLIGLILVHMFPEKIIDFMDCGANC